MKLISRTRTPGIHAAIIEIAYDNGIVNRDHTEQEVLDHIAAHFITADDALIDGVDTYLRSLPTAHFQTLCSGEEQDRKNIGAPPYVMLFLDDLFENMVPT